MKNLILVATAGFLLAGCAVDDGRRPNVNVGVAIGGDAPARGGGPPPWAPAHGRRAKEAAYRYYYYPASGVYLNISTGTYFYLSGGTWQVSARLPPSVVIDTADYVSLELATDKPYLFYDEHRVKFKGKKGHPKGKGQWKDGGPPF